MKEANVIFSRPRSNRRKLSKAYLIFAIIGILVTIIGFIPTYFRPLMESKSFALVYHIHGFFGASWLIFFLLQTLLVNKRNVRLHMKLGYLGLFFMLGMVISLQTVGFVQTGVILAQGEETVITTFLGTVLDALSFGVLVTLAIIYRNRSEVHKRLMLLATIIILWVSWVRLRHYFPPFPFNFDLFGFGLGMLAIPVFWYLEKNYFKKIHPVMLWVGIAVLLEQGLQVILYEFKWYREFAASFYHSVKSLL